MKTISKEFPKPIEVTSFEGYLKEVQIIENKIDINGNKHLMLFRGQSESNWNLIPGLGRPQNIYVNIREREKKMMEDFKRRAIPYLPTFFNQSSDWDWIALAQHFKLPTRLLDWTENPLTALYFAFTNDKKNENSRTVWLFITDESSFVDTKTNASSPYNQNITKVFVPKQITQRINVQNGWFTVHRLQNDNFVPLNHNRLYFKKIFKFNIPNSLRRDILIKLDRLGINSHSIFPDLEGLSSLLEWRYLKR